MNPIEKKVRGARRRLLFSGFAKYLCWTLFAAWLIAGLAIGASSVWVLPWNPQNWNVGWVVGSTVAALLVSLGLVYFRSPSMVTVATEVDARFQLKQRLSSVLAMKSEDRGTAMGKALIDDASRRAERLQVSERFPLAPSRLGWLPILPAIGIAVALLVGPASPGNASSTPTAEMIAQANQIKKSTEALKKKVQEQKKKAEAAGLKDAAEMFSKIEADIEKMSQRETVKPKEALIAINDLKKQLDERRKQLGSPDAMKQSLSKMSEHEKGPAEKIVKAMKEGDFADAKEQAKTLAEKLRSEKLTEAEKQALQKQVEALGKQLKQAADEHEREKQDLQQKIEDARKEGRSDDAAKMQQELNQLEAKDGQMQSMQKMAESMQAAADAMAKGDAEQAAEALEGMSEQLGDMQDAMEQLQDIEETLDTLSQSKDQMRCRNCSGQGCKECQGGGQGEGEGDGQGEGKLGKNPGKGGSKYGLGKGSGLSGPEEKDGSAQSYESQVRGEPKQGRGMNAGFADGPNRKGATREDVKQAVLGAISDESDPLENQSLPRAERQHAKEYFDRLRSGK